MPQICHSFGFGGRPGAVGVWCQDKTRLAHAEIVLPGMDEAPTDSKGGCALGNDVWQLRGLLMGNNLTSRSSPLDGASTEAPSRAAGSATRVEDLGIGSDPEQQAASIREAFSLVPVAKPTMFWLSAVRAAIR